MIRERGVSQVCSTAKSCFRFERDTFRKPGLPYAWRNENEHARNNAVLYMHERQENSRIFERTHACTSTHKKYSNHQASGTPEALPHDLPRFLRHRSKPRICRRESAGRRQTQESGRQMSPLCRSHARPCCAFARIETSANRTSAFRSTRMPAYIIEHHQGTGA